MFLKEKSLSDMNSHIFIMFLIMFLNYKISKFSVT